MKKAFTYRLYPTRKQADTLQFTLDRNRELYNASLEERKEAYRMSKMSLSYEDQSAQLPEIKEIRPEYQEIYSQVLQDTLKRVDWEVSSQWSQRQGRFESVHLRCCMGKLHRTG